MKNFREVGKLAGFCAALGLLIFMAGAVFSPLQSVRDFIHNPFGFSTSITPSGPVVLMQMQKLAKLETGKYNGQTIVTGENKGILPVMVAGDRLVFVPSTTMAARPQARATTEKCLAVFERTHSYKTSDYQKITMNGSYFLTLLGAYLEQK